MFTLSSEGDLFSPPLAHHYPHCPKSCVVSNEQGLEMFSTKMLLDASLLVLQLLISVRNTWGLKADLFPSFPFFLLLSLQLLSWAILEGGLTRLVVSALVYFFLFSLLERKKPPF